MPVYLQNREISVDCRVDRFVRLFIEARKFNFVGENSKLHTNIIALDSSMI